MTNYFTSDTTVKGMLYADGGITCDNDKFIIENDSGKTTINGDVSLNQNVTIQEKLNVFDDVSINKLLATDVSFTNLDVDGNLNVNNINYNNTSIQNTVILSTSIDISNQGTGPAIKVSQYGTGDGDSVALFDSGSEGPALLINSMGKSTFYKDVSFNQNVDISGTLDVSGTTTLTGLLNANGGIAVDTNKFTVADGTGNTSIAGTLGVTGLLNANGGITCDNDKFIIENDSGKTTINGDVSLNQNVTIQEKLDVIGTIKGTDLTITNDITCNNDLSVDGDGNFKSLIVNNTGPLGGSIGLTGELTINTPSFYGGSSLLKCNGTSYFNGNVGIGIDTSSNPLRINETTASYELDDNTDGTIVMSHNNTNGSSRILFKSANNTTDFGAIQFSSSIDDGQENAVLRIIAGNDGNNQDSIRFRTNELDRMTIIGNGRVGIGTTNPTKKLDVIGTIQGTDLTITNNITCLGNSYLNGDVVVNDTNLTYGVFDVKGDGRIRDKFITGQDGNLEIKTNSSTNGNETITMQTFINDNGVNNPSNLGGDQNRYRLCLQDRKGVVIIGSNAMGGSNGILRVKSEGSEEERQDGAVFIPSSDTNHIINFVNTADNVRGKIKGVNSNSVSYDTSSDRRLKTNIEDMDNQLDNIMNLQPRKFDWISDNDKGYGFIAQEVHKIYPQFREKYNETYCSDNPNYHTDCPCDASGNMWYYGLDYGNFTPYIIKAFQEYKIQTDTLIQNLEERIKALEEI